MPELTARLIPWGNSYGLRIRKADVQRLGLQAGQDLTCIIADFTQPKDLRHWPKFDFGPNGPLDHDTGFDAL